MPIPAITQNTVVEEDLEKKKPYSISTKMDFKSEFFGKSTQIKFEEKKPDFKSDFEPKNDDKSFEVNLKGPKKSLSFFHENEDIIMESSGKPDPKKYLKSYESNL